MTIKVSVQEIPIFKNLSPQDASLLSAKFKVLEYTKGQIVAEFGKPVEGIYIINEGKMEVQAEKFDTCLAVLEKGSCFGEMSLIEDIDLASANLVVQSDSVRLLYCSKQDFKILLNENPNIASSFYKGASELLSQRLRNTNKRVVDKLYQAYEVINNLIEKSNLLKYLGKTRKEIDDTGSKIVGGVFEILPILEDVIKQEPSKYGELEKATAKIEKILFNEAHNFDKISQELDIILQYFLNVCRFLKGEQLVNIRGDTHLFDDT